MQELIKSLIEGGYLRTKKIIEAFYKIKRADFTHPDFRDEADKNIPLPIGFGQTISQPLAVAFMLELLQPQKGDKILDIGSGSGWQTVLLAEIAGDKGKIYGIERIRELKKFGEENTRKYNFIKRGRVKFLCQDGANGFLDEAPFDKIIVAAAVRSIPDAWMRQLKIGGRMVLPFEGIDGFQSIILIEKIGENKFKKSIFPGFVFVPFVEENTEEYK